MFLVNCYMYCIFDVVMWEMGKLGTNEIMVSHAE